MILSYKVLLRIFKYFAHCSKFRESVTKYFRRVTSSHEQDCHTLKANLPPERDINNNLINYGASVI